MSKVVCIILKCKKQRNYTIEAYLNWSWLQLKDLHHLVYQTLVPNLWVENFRACPSFTCNRPWTKSGQIYPWIETQYICHFPGVPPWDEYQFSATTSSRYCLDWREQCLRMEYQHEMRFLYALGHHHSPPKQMETVHGGPIFRAFACLQVRWHWKPQVPLAYLLEPSISKFPY